MGRLSFASILVAALLCMLQARSIDESFLDDESLSSGGSPAAQAPVANSFFYTNGSKIFDADGQWVVFRGIGFTCTEYFARPIFGTDFAWEACFGGPPPPHYNSTPVLSNETQFVLNYLKPDTLGGNFPTKPVVKKVSFDAPFDEVIDTETYPSSRPMIRIPLTASTYISDLEANGLKSAGYRQIIDMLVQYFTSNGVMVILDHHESCTDGKLYCQRGGPMALRNFGNLTNGSLIFWDLVSKTYADNPLVAYELYNEPHVWFQAFYGGDPTYAGMRDMLSVIRQNTDGLVIIGGHDQYSQDAAGSVAFYMEYLREFNNTPPKNVIYNLHPYIGVYQSLEHSLRSTMRLMLALKTIGPVIFTEFGQYCCSPGPEQSCQKTTPCNDHEHGDFLVYNLANLAAQYDFSWVGWAWRGRGGGGGNCSHGDAECGSPDMRGNSIVDGWTGVLTNGSMAGANWSDTWQSFVQPLEGETIVVQDALPNVHLNGTAYEPRGYLPRPCIVGQFNIGNYCGYPLGTNTSLLDWNSLWNQTVFESVLPGLPPSTGGNATTPLCTLQTCPGYPPCNMTSPIIPMPNPCKAAECEGKE